MTSTSSDLDRYRDEFPDRPMRNEDTGSTVVPDAVAPDIPPAGPPPGGCGMIFRGCGCLLIVLLVAAIAVGVWVVYSWRSIAANVGHQIAVNAITAAELPEGDRRRILEWLDQIREDFAEGRIDVGQLGRMVEAIAEGWFVPLAMIAAADAKYVQTSGLDRDEKLAGRRTLERLAQAIVTQKIGPQDAETLLAPVLETKEVGTSTLKEKVTDAELREFLAGAKERVDAIGIPDQPFTVNVADEFDKAINQALGK